ncbi:MAG: hypothetical protein ABIH20_06415 [Candidatus Diapherotrites archaeon]
MIGMMVKPKKFRERRRGQEKADHEVYHYSDPSGSGGQSGTEKRSKYGNRRESGRRTEDRGLVGDRRKSFIGSLSYGKPGSPDKRKAIVARRKRRGDRRDVE